MDGKLYGCYLGSYEKRYRWQCKSFSTESESTEFAIRGANKDNSPITLLVEINPMMPEFMHPYLLERFIKQRLVKVDIVEK